MAKAPTAKRYAHALFALAQEQGAEEAWLEELGLAGEALAEPTVSFYLGTPRMRTEDKTRAVSQLMEGRAPLVANMVGLLVARQAASLLPQVIEAYSELLNAHLGRVWANVMTATPTSDEQQERLRTSLGAALSKEVVLDPQVDSEIIGGVVVRVGDQIIDGSVRSRLVALRRQLERESLT